ncbi:hypothetical protein KJ359_005073 [Pestalotiopsis sp. 9143b]|nr:hypothetical protein KJ359_005073 [Pestalotiopsis sp. 9143b]
MGVAAMNVAAVELFDEMNTVNEKYAKFLASDDCLVFFLVIIALAVGFMATDMVDEVRELPCEYDYKKQDDDLSEYEEVKEIGIIEQLRGPRTRLEDSMV